MGIRHIGALLLLFAVFGAKPAHALPSLSGACLTAWRTIMGWPGPRPDVPRSVIRNQSNVTAQQVDRFLDELSPQYDKYLVESGSLAERRKDLFLFIQEMPGIVQAHLSPAQMIELFSKNEGLFTKGPKGLPDGRDVSYDFLRFFWTPKSHIVGAYVHGDEIIVPTHANYDQFVRSGLPKTFRGKKIRVVESTRPNSHIDPAWMKAHSENFYPDKPVVLLTGATSGLGLSMAKQLIASGKYRVILTGREKSLAYLKEAGIKESDDVKIMTLDITSEPDRQNVVSRAIEDWGGVDILINNASITHRGSVEDTGIDSARQQMETDYLGPRELTRGVIPLMRVKGRGRIINISSIAGAIPLPMMETYSAAKSALDAHSSALSKEMTPFGIKVSIAQVSILPTEGIQRVKETGMKGDPKNPYAKAENAAADFSHWAAAQTDATPDSVAHNILATLNRPSPPFLIQPSTDSKIILLAKRFLPGPIFRAFMRNSMPHYQNWAQIDPPGVRPGQMTGPLASVQQGIEFARNFVGDLRGRAQDITDKPDAVEAALKKAGLHQPYVPPVNKTTVKLEGKLVIKGTMGEFFELWSSWIEKGYGSINDRQYADIVMQYRDWVRQFPLLAKMPMTSEDGFSVEIVDGKMQFMVEKTITRFAGLIPTSEVDWVYRRTREPVAANSFERTIDKFNGDIPAVEKFYQDLFDPKHVNPKSGATVIFLVKAAPRVATPTPAQKEFEHGVKGPFGLPVPSALTGGPPGG